MISIVIAIRSLWACKILNEDKKIEVRKGLALYNALKKAEEKGEEVEFLMYVTKDKPLIRLESLLGRKIKYDVDLKRNRNAYSETLDGKVVAKFKDKAEVIKINVNDDCPYWKADHMTFATMSLSQRELLEGACLGYYDLCSYTGVKNNEQDGKSVGTALHIKDLEIFDKPKTLADYSLKRAPESWAYAKEAPKP